MVEEFLESIFPGLRGTSWQITSPASQIYNCIAWAGQDTRRWWWPVVDDEEAWWPAKVDAAETIPSFVAAFNVLGYSVCQDDQVELEVEKVALFALFDGRPTHAARQLSNGRWTSKLGTFEDIEHDLRALEGTAYGRVAQVLKRPVSPD